MVSGVRVGVRLKARVRAKAQGGLMATDLGAQHVRPGDERGAELEFARERRGRRVVHVNLERPHHHRACDRIWRVGGFVVGALW